jgi:hypothetical protein
MEQWKIGILGWPKNILVFSHDSIIPPFHYSKMNHSDLKTYLIHLFESGVER